MVAVVRWTMTMVLDAYMAIVAMAIMDMAAKWWSPFAYWASMAGAAVVGVVLGRLIRRYA